MNLAKKLTPRDTEEVKPGLFIQRTTKGYKQIHPAAWEGKVNWKNFILGGNFLKSFVWFAILMFLAWSYFQDVGSYQEFYEEVNSDPVAFCLGVNLNQYENTNTIQNYDGEDFTGIFSG